MKKLENNKNEDLSNYDGKIKQLTPNFIGNNKNSEILINIKVQNNKKSTRNSVLSTTSLSSSLASPSSTYSTDEIYNYNEHDSFDETEWIITRL